MAPKLSDADVKKIAALARLALTPDETELFSRQLADILAYADAVQQVDTTGVPPTSHPFADASQWREDAPRPSLDRDAVLAHAPAASTRSGLFKVPKVL